MALGGKKFDDKDRPIVYLERTSPGEDRFEVMRAEGTIAALPDETFTREQIDLLIKENPRLRVVVDKKRRGGR